jgi:uncharacterized protein (TIGR02001 family)
VVSLYSDDRFRGYSLSEGRPVAIVDLSYDAPGGFYGAASVSAVAARGEGPRLLGVQLNAGYAARLSSSLTLDLGITHSAYSHYSGLGSQSYTEVYGGIVGKNLSARVAVSPDYFGRGWTAHPEVNGHVSLSSNLDLTGDVGLLVPLGGPFYSKPVYDARFGLNQRIGPLSLHAAFTSRGASRAIYRGHHSSRNALVLGVSYAL